MLYNTGMLIGRAFALANATPGTEAAAAVRELGDLAAGDRIALQLAQARYREFLAGPAGSVEDQRALDLLEAAQERVLAQCGAAR